jgi:YesN/AraC family two-component response regulator
MYFSLSRLSMLDVKWASLFNANNDAFFEQHYNPYYELIVVAEGTVHLQLDQSRIVMHGGESLLLQPWEQHQGLYAKEGQGKFFWVQFSCEPGLKPFELERTAQLDIRHAERTELRTNEARHEDLIVLPRQFVIGECYKLLGMFEELVRTVKKPKGYFRFQATLLLSGMLHLIASEFLEQNHLDHDYPASYITFRKLVDQLNNYYDEDLNKERLEQSVGRKFEYLCQVFKKYANANIHQYVHQLRAQRAKYLLRNSSKSVKEIAEQVGYSDPFVFSRMFKKLEGVAPHYYRTDRTTDG